MDVLRGRLKFSSEGVGKQTKMADVLVLGLQGVVEHLKSRHFVMFCKIPTEGEGCVFRDQLALVVLLLSSEVVFV